MTWGHRRLIALAFLLLASLTPFGCASRDPLPSWNDTGPKRSILEFVDAAVDASSDAYIAPEDRIATFDNDGTLWPEQPFIQALFAH